MPESPEVQALAEFLDTRLTGHEVAETELVEFRALKTRARPLDQLVGQRIVGVGRRGKHLDVALASAHLVVSLGRHGWVRWDEPGDTVDEQTDPPALAALTLDDGGVAEFTDAGSWVSLGLSVVDDPGAVPAVAKLGPDPAGPAFAREDFDSAVRGRRKQIKALLQEQESLAGIGNAYSDEILHAARISPLTHAAALDDDALDRLYTATVGTMRDAVAARRGIPIDRLKEAKTAAMRVHGRTGERCPVCGGTVEDYRTGGTTAQYCPVCQT
ncbi:MAG TPA: DNA-formamidopyrimidine glycosylase family protein [Microbacterium sp.]|nr:DNA-formamidopyrimidine glycosylase family protein [Microbacterium sp.]